MITGKSTKKGKDHLRAHNPNFHTDISSNTEQTRHHCLNKEDQGHLREWRRLNKKSNSPGLWVRLGIEKRSFNLRFVTFPSSFSNSHTAGPRRRSRNHLKSGEETLTFPANQANGWWSPGARSTEGNRGANERTPGGTSSCRGRRRTSVCVCGRARKKRMMSWRQIYRERRRRKVHRFFIPFSTEP